MVTMALSKEKVYLAPEQATNLFLKVELVRQPNWYNVKCHIKCIYKFNIYILIFFLALLVQEWEILDWASMICVNHFQFHDWY